MEVYAPRAALYEVLPDFLLRLSDPGASRERPSRSQPVWFTISRGSGSYQAARSTVGTAYDFDRFEAEAGLNVTFAEDAGTWFSARYLNGSADVSAATGGGAITAKGLGPALGVYWGGANSFYADAGYALTVYDVDLSSDTRGLLKAGGAGYGQSVDVELGRNIALGESVNLTPRAWAVGSRVSVDDFTDAVNSRVSFPDADRLMGGLGTVVEAARAWDGRSFSLRGSVDFERMFSGAETIALVSGESLRLEAATDSILVGLNAEYRQSHFSLGAKVWLREVLDSNAREYSGILNVGVRF